MNLIKLVTASVLHRSLSLLIGPLGIWVFGFTFISSFFFFFPSFKSFILLLQKAFCLMPTISINFTFFLTDPDFSRYNHMKTTSEEPFFFLICLIGWHILFVPDFFPAFPQHIRLAAWVDEREVISFRPCQELLHQPVDAFLVLTPNMLFASSALLAPHTEHESSVFCRKPKPWLESLGGICVKGPSSTCACSHWFLRLQAKGKLLVYINKLLGKVL